jgi:hypothetical protein
MWHPTPSRLLTIKPLDIRMASVLKLTRCHSDFIVAIGCQFYLDSRSRFRLTRAQRPVGNRLKERGLAVMVMAERAGQKFSSFIGTTHFFISPLKFRLDNGNRLTIWEIVA